MLQGLLFDLDGTLANTDPIHFRVWQDMMHEFGQSLDRPFYQARFSGRTNQAIVADLLPQLSTEAGQQLADRKEALFRQRAQAELTPLPGLLTLLAWSQKFPQGIVTNAPAANADFMLTTLHVGHYFQTVVLAETLERGKPDPLPYHVGLERLGLTASQTIAFEDSPSGIRSAVGAGISTIGIASTHTDEELHAVGATLVIPDFTDRRLWQYLEQVTERVVVMG